MEYRQDELSAVGRGFSRPGHAAPVAVNGAGTGAVIGLLVRQQHIVAAGAGERTQRVDRGGGQDAAEVRAGQRIHPSPGQLSAGLRQFGAGRMTGETVDEALILSDPAHLYWA